MKLSKILLATVGISFFGCQNNFLDTLPTNTVSSGIIWSNANLARQAVTGVYNQLLADYSTNSASAPFWDARSQLLDFDANWVSNIGQLNGTATPSTNDYLVFWKRLYTPIHRANDVIANIALVPDMTSEEKARLTAECRFIRAWYYYRLNVLWKGVPIYLEPVSAFEANKARSSEEQVWNVILDDLGACIGEPSLPNKYTAASAEFGRITKGAAHALRGKANLWLKKYAEAASDFTAVTHMGYSLFSDYKQLFKEESERSDEMIFSVQFIEQAGFGNAKSWAFGNRGSAGAGWNNYLVNPAFVESYQEISGKTFSWEDYLPGYDAMTPRQRSVFFLRDNMTATEIETMRSFGADITKYLPQGNEDRIKAAYANRDPRLRMNVITPYATYLGGLTGVETSYTLRWPYRGSDRAEPFDLRTDTNSKFYYLIRKFVFEGREHIFQQYSPVDIPLIRYADVLLNLAEALNEQGKTEEAIPYVNLVRERAGVALLNSNGFTQVTGTDDMRERIRNERYWELAFEDHMYFDELRWATWKQKKFYTGNGLMEIWGTTTYTYNWVGEQNWVWPIPAVEMEMNSNLTQNQGWFN